MVGRKLCVCLIILGAALFSFSPRANAEAKFGVRAGAYFDANSAFIGGEGLFNVFSDSWYFNPNLEYVFVDNGNLWTLNFDFHYDLPVRPVYVWVGAGPAILHRDRDRPVDRSDTDFGVNLFMGVGFKLRDSRLIPYIQPKVILSDNSEFSLAFGLRF
jgi:hypothetical protein